MSLSNANRPFFTVFTPTFNRAATLHRVYESLCAQTYRDFEWLVVDDGSQDDTRSIVETWQREAPFPIRYLWQENQGKHIAFNLAVREAHGDLLVNLDSDDACVPEALERFAAHWESIPIEERDRFVGVTALCKDQTGRLVGETFPGDVLDSDYLECLYRFHIRGEKWSFHRTDVLRNFPFPEDIRNAYVLEGVVWSAIARHYKSRCVNDLLRIYWVEGPSLSHGQNPAKYARTRGRWHLQQINEHGDYFRYAPLFFLLLAIFYIRCSFHCGDGILTQYTKLKTPLALGLWLSMLPVGFLVYLRDRIFRNPPETARSEAIQKSVV